MADGMGGHSDGERASIIAAKKLGQHVANYIYLPLLSEEQKLDSEQKTIPEALEEGMDIANQAVTENVPGGGSTVTAAVIHGDLVHVAHVGDSRAYLINDGNMELITTRPFAGSTLTRVGSID